MITIDAINRMLRFVGELPVPTSVVIEDLPDGHEAKQAQETLLETKKELQQKGWWFNTEEWTYPLSGGYIYIPNTVISVKGTGSDRYLIKGGTLYDINNRTKIFETGLTLTTIFDSEFEDLPESFATLVTYEASKALHSFLNGDAGTQSDLDVSIIRQTIRVEKEDMANNTYNMITNSRLIDRGSNPIALI